MRYAPAILLLCYAALTYASATRYPQDTQLAQTLRSIRDPLLTFYTEYQNTISAQRPLTSHLKIIKNYKLYPEHQETIAATYTLLKKRPKHININLQTAIDWLSFVAHDTLKTRCQKVIAHHTSLLEESVKLLPKPIKQEVATTYRELHNLSDTRLTHLRNNTLSERHAHSMERYLMPIIRPPVMNELPARSYQSIQRSAQKCKQCCRCCDTCWCIAQEYRLGEGEITCCSFTSYVCCLVGVCSTPTLCMHPSCIMCTFNTLFFTSSAITSTPLCYAYCQDSYYQYASNPDNFMA